MDYLTYWHRQFAHRVYSENAAIIIAPIGANIQTFIGQNFDVGGLDKIGQPHVATGA